MTLLRWLGALTALTVLTVAPAPAASSLPNDDPVGVWPLAPQPEVVHRFAPPATPYAAGHRGVDLLGRPGQQVRAALPGTVTYAGLLAGRGVVVVGHGETRTTYEPVQATVEVGRTVTAGTTLGTLQPVASHCWPRSCLHWGWVHGETYLDPLQLVGLRPIRLLPLWRDRPVDEVGVGPPGAVALDGPGRWLSLDPPLRLAGVLGRRPLAAGLW